MGAGDCLGPHITRLSTPGRRGELKGDVVMRVCFGEAWSVMRLMQNEFGAGAARRGEI